MGVLNLVNQSFKTGASARAYPTKSPAGQLYTWEFFYRRHHFKIGEGGLNLSIRGVEKHQRYLNRKVEVSMSDEQCGNKNDLRKRGLKSTMASSSQIWSTVSG